MTNQNVLFIISSLKHGGGAEKVCSIIGTKLQEKGYNIHFLTFYDESDLYPFKGVYFSLKETNSKNPLIKIFKLFVRAYKIKKYCKQNGINVCIGQMEEANFSTIISKIIFKNKSKIIIQIHTSINNARGCLYLFLIKLLYKYADCIITIVNQEKENLIKNYNICKEKINVIYNPIDIKTINKLKKENISEDKYLFDKNIFTFITIGRLISLKNHEFLIKVFKRFNKKYLNTQLIIIGEGELRNDLEEKIGNNQNIYLLGKKHNPYKYLYSSNSFVFTSKFEGFGIVIIEAMSCDLPIISIDCPIGPKEILKKTIVNNEGKNDIEIKEFGILVEINDEVEMYNSFEKILLNEEIRKKYILKSIERSKDFDIDIIILKWESILNNKLN